MALRIHIEMTQGKPQITVLRKQNKSESLVGIFSLDSLTEVRAQLTLEEQYEWENWLGGLNFAQSWFPSEVDTLVPFIIQVPPAFQAALFQLWQEAPAYGLEFIPMKEILESLLRKAKTVERKINQRSGKKPGLLEPAADKVCLDAVRSQEGKKLFQRLLALNIPTEEIAQAFQAIAYHDYQKTTRFEAHFFKHYADPYHQKPIPKWYYAVAIDLLHRYGVNPLTVLSPPQVAKYWAKLKVKQMSLTEAQQLFLNQFQPTGEAASRCLAMIQVVYAAN